MSGSPSAILRLDSTQLADSGQRIASTIITTPSAGLETLSALAFGDDGTLWIASQSDSLLLGFSPEALATSGSHAASVVISAHDRSLSAPSGLAFDRAGQLWVTNSGTGTIVRFDPAQLVTSGAPTPAVTISGLSHPSAIAIDRVGGLWFTDRVANTVSRFTFGELANSGTPQPTVELRATGTSLSAPTGLAIDSAGTLWVANLQTPTLAGFTSDQLIDSGATAPHIVISPALHSFIIPAGLAFDQAGALWVINGSGQLDRFTRDQLVASGAPTPSVHIQINGHVLLWGAAIFPKPTNTPLN